MKSDLALLGGTPVVTDAWPPWPDLGDEDVRAIESVIRGRRLSVLRREGVIAEFEDAFARMFSASHALSFSSGTASLHAACFACGVAPGDEVLTPSYTWISAITAILHANAIPVFCDVAPESFHIDPAEIRRRASPRCRAVIVTHTWGLPAPMEEIVAVAEELGISVIEDVSHAHGGTYRGRPLGTIGDAGCFSLQGTKSIVAGEGGVLLTNDRLIYERAMIPGHHDQRLRQCLTDERTRAFADAGGYWKYRAAPLAIALAHAQLPKLAEQNAARQANFDRLDETISQIPFLRFAHPPAGSRRGFYGCPGLYDYDKEAVPRDLFVKAMCAEGAIVFPGYDVNWYQVPVLQDMSLFRQLWIEEHANGSRYRPLPPGALPNTDHLVESTVVVPAWAQPCPALVDQYAQAFQKVAGGIEELAAHHAAQNRRP